MNLEKNMFLSGDGVVDHHQIREYLDTGNVR